MGRTVIQDYVRVRRGHPRLFSRARRCSDHERGQVNFIEQVTLMPLRGTLRDLSLSNLIQVQCSEQRPSWIRLVRRGHEAFLGFDKGELIFASLDGPLASRWSVNWLPGMTPNSKCPFPLSQSEQNVFAPWSALLLEGMRQLDETRVESSAFHSLLERFRDSAG